MEDYRSYAESLVSAEGRGVSLPRKVTFFGPSHGGDDIASRVSTEMIKPLAASLLADYPDWEVETVLREEARRARLSRLLGGPETPALLVSMGHGVHLPYWSDEQDRAQGALICSDWLGPGHRVLREHYFTGEDLDPGAHLHGLISILFSDYSAGAPQHYSPAIPLSNRFGSEPMEPVARKAFVSSLAKHLLSHPAGGALAVMGFVGNWSQFSGESELPYFEDIVRRLVRGVPLGHATEVLRVRYVTLAAELALYLDRSGPTSKMEEEKLDKLWTMTQGARNWILLGDPAVRLLGTTRRRGRR